MPGETRYARLEDGYVAYQVIGDGPIDLVHIGHWLSDIEGQWEYPALARFLERLSTFSRLICFDRRGCGLADPIDPDDLTLDQWMEDVRAVMDAVGSESPVLLGFGESGPMGMLWAATHPDRTTALVLVNTRPTGLRQPDFAFGFPREVADRAVENFERSFAKDPAVTDAMEFIAPDPRDREWTWRLARRATSPRMAARLMRVSLEMDVRDILPVIRVPTLVIQREANAFVRVENGRYLGEHIPGAKYVELPGADHFPWAGDQGAILDEVEEFLTGVRPMHEPDRVLATVLFTDIVSSTEQAAVAGDRRWREILDEHNTFVARELVRFRGRKVHSIGLGDGVLATFDGPARAVRCARAIVDGVREMGLEVRAGVHTGEVELISEGDVAGIAVHIGARVAALASADEVLVSRTVTDLVAGSGLTFAERGSHVLKGVPGEWQLYAVER